MFQSCVGDGGQGYASSLQLVEEREVTLGAKIGEGSFGEVLLAKYYEAQLVRDGIQRE